MDFAAYEKARGELTSRKPSPPIYCIQWRAAACRASRRIDALTSEVRDDRNWKTDFKDALANQTGQIDKLLEGLKEEKDARRAEDDRIRGRLDTMASLFTGARIAWVVVAILIAAILGGLADHYIPKWLGS
ncbi:MAG TPA: hypothetical protein VH020_07275 [Stellaceae bacterium]|nr:hypothetical protein [Stellaceae bacterium]